MPRLIVLGSSYAVPDAEHANTHLALTSADKTVLVDCGNNPIVRLQEAGIPFDAITDIILTHTHPDHIGALPSMLMSLWLLKRVKPLALHGMAVTVERTRQILDLFGCQKWPNFFPLHFHVVPMNELSLVLETKEFRVLSSPVRHWVPTLGLRVEMLKSGKVAAYSCDTAPDESVVNLGRDADVLFHEAAGADDGHSSAEQAGEIAAQAGAKELYLIHYPTGGFDYHTLIARARTTFPGPVYIAEDLMSLDLD